MSKTMTVSVSISSQLLDCDAKHDLALPVGCGQLRNSADFANMLSEDAPPICPQSDLIIQSYILKRI